MLLSSCYLRAVRRLSLCLGAGGENPCSSVAVYTAGKDRSDWGSHSVRSVEGTVGPGEIRHGLQLCKNVMAGGRPET